MSSAALGPLTLLVVLYGGWPFKVAIIVAMLIALHEWFSMVDKTSNALANKAVGVFYIIFSLCSYLFLRFGFEEGAWLCFVLIISVWASDIGAYAAGKTLKGPKMAPKTSPNKTWAGLAGAMASFGLSFLVFFYIRHFVGDYIDTDIGLRRRDAFMVFCFGAFLGFVGQTGDLFISSYKRKANIKDTGTLIPGHGGLLDRIDALLLVSPIFLMILMLWLD